MSIQYDQFRRKVFRRNKNQPKFRGEAIRRNRNASKFRGCDSSRNNQRNLFRGTHSPRNVRTGTGTVRSDPLPESVHTLTPKISRQPSYRWRLVYGVYLHGRQYACGFLNPRHPTNPGVFAYKLETQVGIFAYRCLLPAD